MTDDNEREGILDRVKDAVTGGSGRGIDTGSDALADIQTNVADAAGETLENQPGGAACGDEPAPRFGPSEGGIADILPGGPAPDTDEDESLES